MTVERVRVGDVLQLKRRQVDPDPVAEYREIGVRSFGKGLFHKEPVVGHELGSKRVFRVEPGDLVLSNVFAWEGAIALVSEAERGMIGSHRFMTYVARDGRILPTWAAWFFLSERGLDLIRHASPGSAGRNRTLAIERFENLEIPIPEIADQRQTAQRLDVVNERVGAVSSSIAERGVIGAKASLPEFVEAALRRDASGYARVADLADFVSDTVHPADDPAPADRFVGLQHIESHTGRRIGSDPLGQMKGRKFRFRPGDVVYGYLRPYLNKVWVADAHGLCSVDQYVLRPHEDINPELFAFALRGRGVLAEAVDKTHNLQLPRLRSGLLGAVEVPVVPTEKVEGALRRLKRLETLILEISQLRIRQQELAARLVPAAVNAEFVGLR